MTKSLRVGLSLAIFCGALPAQAPTAVPLPTAPEKLLKTLSDSNGLAPDAGSPWHIKLSWDQFDDDGDNVHSGTIEEFHAGLKRDRTIYGGDDFNQIAITNDGGTYLSGDKTWPKFIELRVKDEVLRPLRRARFEPNGTKLKTSELTLGSLHMVCVSMHRTDLIETSPPQFCSDPNAPELRYVRGLGVDQTVFNHLIQFQGRWLAQDITVTHSTKPYLKIHVDELEVIRDVDNSLFDVTQDSSPLTGPIEVPSSMLVDEYLLKKNQLSTEREHGTVKVHFVVGKDGHVSEVTPLNGTPSLGRAAVRVMRSYQFRPFLVADRPIEVAGTMEFSWN